MRMVARKLNTMRRRRVGYMSREREYARAREGEGPGGILEGGTAGTGKLSRKKKLAT